MTEEEIYEELEITYGKPPRTTSEKNMIWLKGVLEEHIIEGELNEDVPKPSLDALAMTLIAITTYDIPMEELAAKKPAIKRTLLWFIVKCHNHYDEIEPVIGHCKSDHRLGRNFYKGLFGDYINVMLAATAYNLKRAMRALWCLFRWGLMRLMTERQWSVVTCNVGTCARERSF